ncbi:PIG-X [Tricladium varicosporioides]|nr:PIG-X [Hymenoscyphus varicosporioides]
MRQRITFIQKPEDSVDPENLKVTNNAISSKTLKAAREDRVTFGFDELPQELYRVLKASHELHMRWVNRNAYDTIAPLVSRLSPGLHVFYTPQRNSNNSNLLCPALRKVFGDLECLSPEQSFTSLPTERFSLSAATQYFNPLSSLNNFVTYITHKLCKTTDSECILRVTLLSSASTVDIDFDTISHALTLTAFWPIQDWDLNFKSTPGARLEVGILSVEQAVEPEELSLGGFLTVIGEDSKPSPTLFSFPARHHPTEQSFSSSFISPTGLHPTLQLRINSWEPPKKSKSCSMHVHLTLPKEIFADKYQLSDPLFLASKNLSSIRYITNPVDLEAPAYTTFLWGSSLLLELAPPKSSFKEAPWTAQIPLHLRYLLPNFDRNGQQDLEVPYPVVFWACTADEGSKFPINPFDRVNLGYEALFGRRTLFHHLNPEEKTGGLVNSLNVPVLDLGGAKRVESGTAVVVGLGFAWVLWCLFRVWRRGGYGRAKAVAGVENKKEK